jgi:putative ABC transport system ATP-binding protein
MLTCNNLSYKINEKIIINSFNFSLKQGEHLLVLGPSGSGKTSLLSILAGMQPATTGTVEYDGVDLYKLSMTERDKFRGNNLGIIFQNFYLIHSLNIYQNILIAANMAGKKVASQKIYDYLQELGLDDIAQQKVTKLSNGQAQRLAVIRGFINQPKWLLCDEPTSALDDANTGKLLNLLKDQAKNQHSSLIIVTHDQRVKKYFKNHHILEL